MVSVMKCVDTVVSIQIKDSLKNLKSLLLQLSLVLSILVVVNKLMLAKRFAS